MTTTQGEVASVARKLATQLSSAEALNRAVDEITQRTGLDLSGHHDLASLARRSAFGFGVLQPYFDDETVEEIWINRPNEVFVSRAGLSERVFMSLSHEYIMWMYLIGYIGCSSTCRNIGCRFQIQYFILW